MTATFSQIEVAIAAAYFGDKALIRAFNRGDVYIAVAKRVFRHQIPPDDLRLSDKDFKRKYKHLRDAVKPLVLGIIYGKTIPGIASDLKISHQEAAKLWHAFERSYPTICRRMREARQQSVRRGYAYMCGLRRFRAVGADGSAHEQCALGNAYVQGTAGLVFFDAANRLRQLYRRYGAHILLPVHDSIVFEVPLRFLKTVARLTQQVMVQTVREWFPELRPRAEVNISYPACWNHEGNHDSVERFIENPMLRL